MAWFEFAPSLFFPQWPRPGAQPWSGFSFAELVILGAAAMQAKLNGKSF
jgi:hypothetical protein